MKVSCMTQRLKGSCRIDHIPERRGIDHIHTGPGIPEDLTVPRTHTVPNHNRMNCSAHNLDTIEHNLTTHRSCSPGPDMVDNRRNNPDLLRSQPEKGRETRQDPTRNIIFMNTLL